MAERQARLDEAIAIVRGVWETEPYTYEGRYYSCTAVQILPPPLQHPGPPLMIAGGGERVTLRQLAEYADACNLGDFGEDSGSGGPAGIPRKLEVLRRHCEAVGRSYESVLRTHLTGWLILAEDDERLGTKVRGYVPEGLDQRFTGDWAGFTFAGTPEQAVGHYRSLAEVGIQYFIVQTLDAGDEETT